MLLNKSEMWDQTVMVMLNGAPGDHLHALPALRQLSQKCAAVYMTAKWRGGLVKAVYENTDIIDHFIWLDDQKMKDWTDAQIGEHMLYELGQRKIDKYYDLNGQHNMMNAPEEWDKIPIEEMREHQEKETFYTRFCHALKVPEAKGSRPKMTYSEEERKWLEATVEYLPDLKLVGWQWSGSSNVKEHPRALEILSTLLGEYPDIHILAMGSQLFSKAKIPEKRCVNLAGEISWRQATLLTSIMALYIAPDTSVMVAAQGFPEVPKILLATTTSGTQIAFPETEIIQSTASCSPCYRTLNACEMDDCCGKIDDMMIYAAADKILRK